MTWFRSRLRPVTRLALFALAFQMAVSFGHMDADELGLPSLDLSVPTHAVLNAGHAAIALAGRDRVPGEPDGYCPICASMAQIATAFPSLPPVLVIPPQGRPQWPGPKPAKGISPKLALSFQARAPPTSA